MPARPLAFGSSRTHHAARIRRLLEKLGLALTGAALLCILLFTLVHLNEAVSILRSDPVGGDVYYPSCAAARAAGAAPIYAGRPGYRRGLDADGDGIACEPYRNWGANN
jgi:excalibur calcium-binding domain-containing protein